MPVPTSTIKSWTTEPLSDSHSFGVKVRGPDLNTMSEEQFKELEELIYTHKVLVVKDQKGFKPEVQQMLGIKFDPKTPAELGHMEDVRGKDTVLSKAKTEPKLSMPGAHLVNINGSGSFKAGHYGVDRDFVLKALTHKGFHRDDVPDEETEAGFTRFQRWHIDNPFYKNWPARVTTIWAHTLPKGEPVTVRWSDGSNLEAKSPPGATAFIDCVAMYNALTPSQKKWVDNSLVAYPAQPYQWLYGARCDGLGLRMFDEGKEHHPEDADPAFAQTIPLVWINPVTGERALQVHAIIVHQIHYRESATDEFKVIDDLKAVREMLDDIQRPFITPENVLFAPTEEGDLLCFYNRGVRHSAVGFPESRGPRLLHQLQLVASDPPFDPAPIEGLPYRVAVTA